MILVHISVRTSIPTFQNMASQNKRSLKEGITDDTCLVSHEYFYSGSNNIAIGYDEGSILVKLGREEPAMSMDISGKIIWAKHSEIQQANLKTIGDTEIKDGERLSLSVKDMGSCEVYPQTIAHNPNGR